MKINFRVGKEHPLIQEKLLSVEHKTEFLRDLIRDDMYCHDVLVADLSKTNPPPGYDVFKVLSCPYSINLVEGKDDDIIQHMKSISHKSEYIIDLLYYSIGEDPEKHKRAYVHKTKCR